jgi:PIN domain nuclease of toxin-antitoxin system
LSIHQGFLAKISGQLPDLSLWATAGRPELKAKTRRLIESADAVYISAASIWEISIKAKLGKIKTDPDELEEVIEKSGFLELPIRATHAVHVNRLPLHHNDPFDRLLVAQAMSEPLVLLTADTMLAQYSDLVRLV